MVIESLSPNDKILSFLPPSLRSLSILCSPRFTVVEAHITPPTPSQLQEMLQDSGMSANLRSLRFSIQGAIDDRLLEYIAARFPALEILHVQRNAIGGVFSETAVSHSIDHRSYTLIYNNPEFHRTGSSQLPVFAGAVSRYRPRRRP
jgi:hypothetical protein